MKKIVIVLLINIISLAAYCQTSADILKILDTRNINDLPNFNKNSIRADLKFRSVVGIPGISSSAYTTNITISPWSDATGGFINQLSFNNEGIYYRTGNFNSTSWNVWQKVLLVDANENLHLKVGNEGTLRIGKINDGGNINVPMGSISNQYNIDFSGYRDVVPDQIGARIAAIRYNNCAPNTAYIQNTALVFFTNPRGLNAGTTDLLERMRISPIGNVGIGTTNPKKLLDVAGTIHAQNIEVDLNNWSDFVFDKDYELPSLKEVEAHIQEHKHLPNIPSEAQVKEEGINIGEMQAKLLQKIEELTLYVIQQDKKIQELESKLNK